MMEELSQLLRELAAQLGTTVEYLWGVLVKQAMVEAIQSVIFFIVIVIAWMIEYKLLKWSLEKLNQWIQEDDDSVWDNNTSKEGAIFLINVFLIVVLVIYTISAIYDLSWIPTQLINPEYWALQQILGSIR